MGQNSGKIITIDGHDVIIKIILAQSIIILLKILAGSSYVYLANDVNNQQMNYVLKVTKWNSNDEKIIERNKLNLIIMVFLKIILEKFTT